MKYLFNSVLVALGCAALMHAQAQDMSRGIMTMATGDVAGLKKNAESGDAAAQVALGDALVSNFKPAEALSWFQKAAEQGSVQAQYLAGNLLLFGMTGIPASATVKPDRSEALRLTFMAATNHHAHACYNLGRAYREGLGTSTNLVTAYAWFSLAARNPANSLGRIEMNQLALQLDTAALAKAQALAASYLNGQWEPPAVTASGHPQLKLQGITLGGKTPLAVINGKTLATGESASLPLKPIPLVVKCLRIEKDYVMIQINGETSPRILQLPK